MTEDLVSLILNPVTQFNSQQLSTSFQFFMPHKYGFVMDFFSTGNK